MADLPFYVDFDPVALQLGPLAIHWYGIMYLLAFGAFWLLGRYRARSGRGPLTEQQVGDLLFYSMVGVVVGGRLGYMLFYGFEQLARDPLSLLRIWEGGMSFHGGLIGVAVAVVLFARRTGCGFWRLTDFMSPIAPLGLMFGRIGNFIGGELWGRVTDVPWGMIFPNAIEYGHRGSEALREAYMAGVLNDQARHPSQLYQAGLEGLLLFVLLWWYAARPRPRMAVTGWFLVGYSVFRSFAELFREPDAHLGFIAGGWLTMGQLLSLPMLLLGVGLLVAAYRDREPA